MAITFKKPERKLDSFLVPIRDSRNNKIRIRLADDIVLQKVLRVKDQDAHVIQCIVKDEAIHRLIHGHDQEVLEHVIQNCNAWFGTELSEEKIRDMFLPTLGPAMDIRALVSSIIEPTVVLDNTILGSFNELLPVIEPRKTLSGLRTVLEIEAQGIYIRSKKFGIRWIVRYIRLVQEDVNPIENAFDMSTRIDLTHAIRDDVDELEEQVRSEIAELQNKIRSLEGFVRRARDELEDIELVVKRDDLEAEKEWQARSDCLSKLIWNYQRSRLFTK